MCHYLPSCIYELCEHRRHLATVPGQEAAPVGELVAKVEPVLLHEGLVALDGAVVGVEDELGEGAGLTGPVPAVWAVDHHTHAAGQRLCDEEARLQHRLNVLQPLALVNSLQEVLHGVNLQLAGLYQLAKGVSHDVNVLNPLEHELGVGVERLRLVTFATGPVGHGIDLGPGVHDVKEVGAGIDLDNATDVFFILRRPPLETRQGLGAPDQGRPGGGVIEGQHGKTTLRPKLGASHNEGRGGGGGHHHEAGVGRADPPLQVDAAVHPGAVWETLARELRSEIKECPARVLGEVALGPVLEAVEVLDPERSGEVDEAGVDVLGVLVPVHEECAHSEVGAGDPDGGASCGQRQLVHSVEVHVQDP